MKSGKFFTGLVPSLRFFLSHPGFLRAPIQSFWRVISWYAQVALGRGPVLRIPDWNAVFLLPSNFRSPAKVFYVFRRSYEYEISFLENYLEPGDVFVDGGANFGLYTVLASRMVGESGMVFAFEPFFESNQIAATNIQMNNLKNVGLFELALSDREGTAHLGVHEDPGRNSLALDPGETLRKDLIHKTTIDKFWDAKNLPAPSILKLDVEGHEYRVMLGAQGILGKFHPTILFEMNPAACARAGESAGALPGLLRDLGYSFFLFGDGRLQATNPLSGDFIAIHPNRIHEARCQKLLRPK